MDNTDALGSPKDAGESLGRLRLPFGFLAYLCVSISIFFCYIQVLANLIAPLFGAEPIAVDADIQAVLMWVSALLCALAIYRDRRGHGSWVPFATAAAGLGVIVGTLYGYYDVLILIAGYLLLVIATLLNPAKLLSGLNRSVRAQARELAELNRTLETRVETQVGEIERLARLKRFLSTEVADLVTNEGEDALLNSHRRQIACLFCDIRNFTAFSDSVEPEEVMNLLQAVHERMGRLVAAHGGTIGYRAGDGVMVIFNDPLPVERPVLRAVKLGLDLKAAFAEVQEGWRKLGHSLGIGIGVAYGYATLGLIGAEGRFDYTAIGNVVNIAARLCDRAEDGEILIDKRAQIEVEDEAATEPLGAIELKGVSKPVESFRITAPA